MQTKSYRWKVSICVQAAYLDSILASSFKWPAAARVLHGVWRERHGLLEVYLDVVRSTGGHWGWEWILNAVLVVLVHAC